MFPQHSPPNPPRLDQYRQQTLPLELRRPVSTFPIPPLLHILPPSTLSHHSPSIQYRLLRLRWPRSNYHWRWHGYPSSWCLCRRDQIPPRRCHRRRSRAYSRHSLQRSRRRSQFNSK